MFVIFYVKFLNLDFEDCQFTFGSTSFWVVLDFWVFSFGFWILRSVGPPLIAHLIWVVLDFFILSFLLWILQLKSMILNREKSIFVKFAKENV